MRDARKPDTPAMLRFEGVDVLYTVRGIDRPVLSNLSFSIGHGEAYGLVGESGCGKSTAAFSAVRYLPRNGRVGAGRILVDGEDLLRLDGDALREMRRTKVAMVYQDPGKALNPSIRIGPQVAEVFTLAGLGAAEALDATADILRKVRISDPPRVMERYPHQLSGGMQQRVAIAMALARKPGLLILDEPTTGLDVTVEAEVLDLVEQLRSEFRTSILFISHNLAIVARICERVGVLYAGRLVEEGRTRTVFDDPRHPYTVGLLRCLPRAGMRKSEGRLDTIPGFPPSAGAKLEGCVFANRCALADDRCRREEPALIDLGGHLTRCHYPDRAGSLPREAPAAPIATATIDTAPILKVKHLAKTYRVGEHQLKALSDFSLTVAEGETVGLVGESGSGKTTFARTLLGLTQADASSSIVLDGQPVARGIGERTDGDVKSLQIVFQNPDQALNRAQTVRNLIGRAISRLAGLAGPAAEQRLTELTHGVRLSDRYLGAKPRQLSGGLKQRVAIARAFAGDPRIVVCDEPTSALDVSVQAAILNLLAELQAKHRVSYVFISHDLGVVRYLADRVAVLYLGQLMQIGPVEEVFAGPFHPYTEALMSAIPDISGRQTAARIRLEGEIPSAIDPPSGCVFHTRCPRKLGSVCSTQAPPLRQIGPDHAIRCHIPPAELPRSAS
ncbi:MAG: ABC transporter ATP-binding protein [Hyphomicrobiales bacterium]